MNYQLKSISRAGIAEALAKVELYRYLNEPEESESICRDILAVDPQQQLALRLLGLSITDQFTGGVSDRCREAEEAFERLTDRYEQSYYSGLLHERRAKAQLRAGSCRMWFTLCWSGHCMLCRSERSAPPAMMTPSCAGTAACACCKRPRSAGKSSLLPSKPRTPHRAGCRKNRLFPRCSPDCKRPRISPARISLVSRESGPFREVTHRTIRAFIRPLALYSPSQPREAA